LLRDYYSRILSGGTAEWVLEAGGLCGTDVTIARRERGGHDGVLRERGSAMEFYQTYRTRADPPPKIRVTPLFDFWLGAMTYGGMRPNGLKTGIVNGLPAH
jgi:hypothetical protein